MLPSLLLSTYSTLASLFPSLSSPPALAPTKGAVASEVQLCSDIGRDFLAKGGSAADAMVGMCACVGVIASYHSGFGGGGFATVRSNEGYESIDFRGAAPSRINSTIFTSNKTLSTQVGGLSVTVPGELRGLEAIHSKHGRLPWSDLFQPAIKLARDGFEINRDLFAGMNATQPHSKAPTNFLPYEMDEPSIMMMQGEGEAGLKENKDRKGKKKSPNPHDDTPPRSFLITDPELSKVFAPNGELLTPGSITRRPTYAQTLEKIASKGADAFYEGEIAEGIVRAVQKAGGVMQLEDLKNYQVHSRPLLSISYRNSTVYAPQAPSSGSMLLSTLNTLSGYEIPPSFSHNLSTHRLVEALKMSYGQRTILGDPFFVPNITDLQHSFLLPSSGAAVRSRISDKKTHDAEWYDPHGYEILDDTGTSALVAADESGLVISLTTTVNLYWGSRIMVPESGIVLNDAMDDFSVEGRTNAFGYLPTPSNYIEGNKRPLSSMTPYFIEDPNGDFLFAGSCAGGSRIISANAMIARNIIDFNMTALQAITAPRLHDQIYPPITTLESDNELMSFKGFPLETSVYLTKLGHNSTLVPVGMSVACGVRYTAEGGWEAAGDPRRFDAGGSISD